MISTIINTKIKTAIKVPLGTLLNPVVPTFFSVETISSVQIDLSWTGGNFSHSIERSLNGIDYTEIDTVAKGITTYSNTGLSSDTLYYYRVRSFIGSKYSDYSNVDSDETLVTPLLDSYNGAVGAFSITRLLKSDYTGKAFRVRRSGDNTEQDISFVNGLLDEFSLLMFCGSGDGTITKWYDQSGNNNDATPLTEPKIVSSGEMIIKDGIKIIEFNGTSDGLAANTIAASFTGLDKPISIFAGMYSGVNGASKTIVSLGSSSSGNQLLEFSATKTTANRGYVTKRTDALVSKSFDTVLNNEEASMYSLVVGSIGAAYVDKVLQSELSDRDFDIGQTTYDKFSIGFLGRSSNGNYFNGGLNELIVYSSEKDTDKVSIQDNINSALGSPFYV